MYREEEHPRTSYDVNRDKDCKFLFYWCEDVGIPMVGICRGGQFLNVMSGGSMWQDVNNHTKPHRVINYDTFNTYPFMVSSTHHQMMDPSSEGEILLVSEHNDTRKKS